MKYNKIFDFLDLIYSIIMLLIYKDVNYKELILDVGFVSLYIFVDSIICVKV